jgi:precorrin-2 dehydrogenase/sirohydrochlorin ferrochelatase
MALYPIFLKLEGHKVLIVGGGVIAEQKIEGVLRSATDVTVIAPQVADACGQRISPRSGAGILPGDLLHGF